MIGTKWQDAFEALLASNIPDSKPLAALIRGDEPIPSSARELLAELLDPGKPDYLYFRLTLKSTITEKRRKFILEKEMKAVDLYERLVGEGKSSKEALKAVKEKFIIEERALYYYMKRRDRMKDRLRLQG
jgi:hypothetical protein